jgi:hypothetical protein
VRPYLKLAHNRNDAPVRNSGVVHVHVKRHSLHSRFLPSLKFPPHSRFWNKPPILILQHSFYNVLPSHSLHPPIPHPSHHRLRSRRLHEQPIQMQNQRPYLVPYTPPPSPPTQRLNNPGAWDLEDHYSAVVICKKGCQVLAGKAHCGRTQRCMYDV